MWGTLIKHRVPQCLLRDATPERRRKKDLKREVTLIRTKKSLPVFSPIVPVTLIGVNNVVLFSKRKSRTKKKEEKRKKRMASDKAHSGNLRMIHL